MATVIGDKAMNKIVSHLPGVRAEVRAKAEEIAAKAEARLARHKKTGEHSVSVTHGQVDSLVNLDGDHAISVEFGHFTHWGDKYVPGLYILTGAAGLI